MAAPLPPTHRTNIIVVNLIAQAMKVDKSCDRLHENRPTWTEEARFAHRCLERVWLPLSEMQRPGARRIGAPEAGDKYVEARVAGLITVCLRRPMDRGVHLMVGGRSMAKPVLLVWKYLHFAQYIYEAAIGFRPEASQLYYY